MDLEFKITNPKNFWDMTPKEMATRCYERHLQIQRYWKNKEKDRQKLQSTATSPAKGKEVAGRNGRSGTENEIGQRLGACRTDNEETDGSIEQADVQAVDIANIEVTDRNEVEEVSLPSDTDSQGQEDHIVNSQQVDEIEVANDFQDMEVDNLVISQENKENSSGSSRDLDHIRSLLLTQDLTSQLSLINCVPPVSLEVGDHADNVELQNVDCSSGRGLENLADENESILLEASDLDTTNEPEQSFHQSKVIQDFSTKTIETSEAHRDESHVTGSNSNSILCKADKSSESESELSCIRRYRIRPCSVVLRKIQPKPKKWLP